MAIQQGIIPLSGKMGDVIFSNRKGKKYAKAKSTKPMNQTVATKKSSADFGVASKLGARMRRAFAPLITIYGDVTVVSRFTQHILKIFKTIPASFVGQKSLSQGDVGIFRDFQFNALAKLDSLLSSRQSKVKLTASGLTIVFKEGLKTSLFKSVSRAKAVVLQLMVYNLSLNDDDEEVICVKDLVIRLDDEHFRGAKLQVPLNLRGEQVACVAIGMHYLWDNDLMIGDVTKRAAAILYAVRLSDGLVVDFVHEPSSVKPIEEDKGRIEWELG